MSNYNAMHKHAMDLAEAPTKLIQQVIAKANIGILKGVKELQDEAEAEHAKTLALIKDEVVMLATAWSSRAKYKNEYFERVLELLGD